MAAPNDHYFDVIRIIEKMKKVVDDTYQLDDEHEEKIPVIVDTSTISTLLVQEKERVLKSLEKMEEEVAKVAKLEEGVKLEPVLGDWGKVFETCSRWLY